MKDSDYNLHTPVPYFFDSLDASKYYVIEKLDANNDKLIRESTQKEFEAIEQNVKILFEFHYFNRKEKEIQENLNDFFNTIQKYNKQIAPYSDPTEFPFLSKDEMYVNINRTFINYLNSSRIFIDHMESKLKHKYGNDSPKYKIFHTAKKKCYDASFPYRFFYHLRNYAEHMNFPINNVEHDIIWHDDSAINKYTSKLSLYFDKNKILKDDRMKRKLATDLRLFADYFPVVPLVNSFTTSIKYLLNTLVLIEKDLYVENANSLMNFVNQKSSGGKLLICKWRHNADGKIERISINPPVELVELLRNALARSE